MRFVPPAALALAILVPPHRAEACGGTFCDGGGQNPSSVDQAYETVLFVQDGPFVEAHVQIAIDPNTDAQKFAWVIPMPAVPEFSVGSQPLFDALIRDTTAIYSTRGEYCYDDIDGSGGGFILDPDGSSVGVDPDIAAVDVVGAFEVTVLEGGTAAGVMMWLGDNGYTQDPDAEPIIAEYLANDHVIVAMKLLPSASTAEVHPIVLRYQGDEPCVPLRLTAIAATPDMGVRAFILGEHRWAPANWRHVVPNILTMSWDGTLEAYGEAIARAVDEAPDGRAFVTEYAGPTDVVGTADLYAPSWDASVFATAEPYDVVTLLNAQGLASCDAQLGACIVPYALLVAMLRKYLPAPPDVNENDFYGCLSCYVDATDFGAWDGPAFAADLDERLIAPGQHAQDLIASWPYLTRLYTRVSAEEMSVDPIFHENPDLPAVPTPGPAVRMCVDCDDDAVATLADGREVYMRGQGWPSFAEMPLAERIEAIPPKGAPLVEVDHRAEIDAALATWNANQECGAGGSASGTDDSDGDDDDAPSEAGDGLDAGEDGSETTSGSAGQGDDGIGGRGCACNSTRSSAPLFVLLAALVRRRRR